MKLTSPTRTVPGIARMPERQNRWFLILCIQNPFLPTSGLGHHCAKAGSATLITRGASALFQIVHPKANIWPASRHRTSQRGGYRRRRILGPKGRCAEGFSDRSWIAKQAHAMIFVERHKHIFSKARSHDLLQSWCRSICALLPSRPALSRKTSESASASTTSGVRWLPRW